MLALAMMRVATMLLSPEEMGKISLVLTTTAFFALFLVNPVGMFINRRIHAWKANGAARYYLTRYASYLLLVAFIASIVLTVLYLKGLIDFGIPFGWLIFLVCGSLIFNTINQTAIPSLNLLGDSRRFVLLTLLTLAASFACATFFVIKNQPLAQCWLLGLLLGQALLAIIGCKILFSHLKAAKNIEQYPLIQKQHLRALFSFAWPVAIAAGLGWVQGQGYRYLLVGQVGLAQLGLFVAGYGISAGIIAGIESVLTTYFQPRLYRDVSLNQDPGNYAQAWQRYALAVIPSLVLSVALIAILAPELTKVFVGKDFQSAADFVIWGAIAETARVLMGVYSLIAHVYIRTHWLILPNLVGAIVTTLLCILLIPNFGELGVGISLGVSGAIVVVLVHHLLARYVGGGPPVQPILMAIFSALVLWGIAISLRQFLTLTGWLLNISTLVPVGLTYLGLQYLFLQQHLKDKRNV